MTDSPGPARPAPAAAWPERTAPPRHAERLGRVALRNLGLTPLLRRLGSPGPLTVWRCELRDGDGRVVPQGTGCGKGRGQEARTGALFEAMEHYLTGPVFFDPGQVVFRSGAELVSGPLAREACAPLLGAHPRVACHTYAALPGAGDHPPLPVPVALTTSWYLDRPDCRSAARDGGDYRELARYGCASGSAVGLTCEEALVHGLNEAVEHDALSLLLARAFLGPRAAAFRPRVVDPASLPADLAGALAAAEDLTGGTVHLLDATTDVGVPVYLAYAPAPPPEHEPGPGAPPEEEAAVGSGASLSPHHAAWRALVELVQGRISVLSPPGGPPPPPPRGPLARYPALYACSRFDLTACLTRAQAVPFPVEREPPPLPVPEQAGILIRRLTAAGLPPYYRVTARLPSGITAVHAFVPGLERFLLITAGLLVLPGPRCRAAASLLPSRAPT
ncbi:YcaO-like family protein [Streptomyces sp. 7-21]|uniref:YcaO-like family protein n=1 Tax=Streptomyces sp. 7-21 TaxID=2802283 RepID=UPI00191D1D68|nr:YcaO-like family protein [Streptomyces sp. 7-21]MBL1068260.1 YcaO-like family protein [Streptomyces sp. 7-21]